MRQVINVWLENKPGALMRVVGVVSATGTNIERLLVTANPHDVKTSTMTIVAEVEPRLRKAFVQRINRLVNVLLVVDVTTDYPDSDSMASFEWLFDPHMLSPCRVEPASRDAGWAPGVAASG